LLVWVTPRAVVPTKPRPHFFARSFEEIPAASVESALPAVITAGALIVRMSHTTLQRVDPT
jgi:hypothetical protein